MNVLNIDKTLEQFESKFQTVKYWKSSTKTIDEIIRWLNIDFGWIASNITRKRLKTASGFCIRLAYGTWVLWSELSRQIGEEIEPDNFEPFLEQLKFHAKRKQTLYDGYNNSVEKSKDLSYSIGWIAEEMGEVSEAITFNRIELAIDECIDLTHCAFLLWAMIMQKLESE